MTREPLSVTSHPGDAAMSGGASNGNISAADREWMTGTAAHRNIRYRLLPGKTSVYRRLDWTLEDQRQLCNGALDERIWRCRRTGGILTYQDQCRTLTECRREIPEMRACPAAIQRGTRKRLDEAFSAFFRRVREGKGRAGFPKFRGRRRFDSFCVVSGVRADGGCLTIPKPGRIPVCGGNPYPDGKPLMAVPKREGRKWFATICYEVETGAPADDGKAIGVDMNVRQVAASDGIIHRRPDLRLAKARIRRWQKTVSRRKKGSAKRSRAVRCLAKAKRKEANIRRNWHHQTLRKLADSAGTVVVEDLETKAMTKSAKRTAGKLGKNVRQKAGLNRGILETGWSSFRRMLEYRAANVISVPPHDTSRTCNACGTVDERSRRSQSEFSCVACGYSANADLSAAANILASGTGARAFPMGDASACGGGSGCGASGWPVKRETDARAA